MKAVVIEAFGGSEQVKIADVPKPEPAANEVLIELAYTSVNPVDWKLREGMLKDLLPHRFPVILGWDAAGIVRAVGSTVSQFVTDDRVFAYCRKPVVQGGTYAEYVAVDEGAVAPVPATLSLAEAASVPLTGLTAWQALFDFAALRSGQTILIHAGAGGVGGMAIQFARQAEATIYTTAGKRNHEYVKGLGADLAIDYTSEDVRAAVSAAAPDGVDVVLDAVGGAALRGSYELVKRGGVLVSIVEPPDETVAAKRGIKTGFVFVEPNGRQLRAIGRLLESGQIRAPDIEEMPLEEAAAALDKNRSGHVRGKLVLKIR